MLRFFSTPLDILRPNISDEELRKKISDSKSPIIQHDFGTALGTVYFVRPDNTDMLEDLIQQLNSQPDGRKPYGHTAWIVGGQNLLAAPTQFAMPYHKLFTQGLSHSREYVAHTISALDEFNIQTGKRIRLSTLVREPPYHLLAKGLFGIDKLPADLVAAFIKFDNIVSGEEEDIDDEMLTKPVTDIPFDFAKLIHTNLLATYALFALDYLPQYSPHRAARKMYMKAAHEFIFSQYAAIKFDLYKHLAGEPVKNILSLSVIEFIKQNKLNIQKLMENNESGFKALLENTFIQSIPSNIFASVNLGELMPAMLYNVGMNTSFLQSLRDACTKHGLRDDLSNMHAVIEADRNENGFLHRLYLEGMRLRFVNPIEKNTKFGDRFIFYVTHPINVDDVVIKAGSVVCIMNGMRLLDPKVGADPLTFNPDRFAGSKKELDENPAAKIPLTAFSYLPRRCPGNKVTEYIAKTYIAYLAVKYDFELYARPNENDTCKILLEFSAREEKKEFKTKVF